MRGDAKKLSPSGSFGETAESQPKRHAHKGVYSQTLSFGFTKEVVNNTKLTKKYLDISNKFKMQELVATKFKKLEPEVKFKKLQQIQEACQNIERMRTAKQKLEAKA